MQQTLLWRALVIGGLLSIALTSCTQKLTTPLTLPHWVTNVQHLDLSITQQQPERRFALMCTTVTRDGSPRYSEIMITVSSDSGTRPVLLPQPNVDCEHNAGAVVAEGTLPLPADAQVGDQITITFEAYQEDFGRMQAPRDYIVDDDGQLLDLTIKRWRWSV